MTETNAREETLSVEEEDQGPGDRGTPFLFLVFRSDRPLEPPHRFKLAGLDEVMFGRGTGRPRLKGRSLELPLADPRMSSSHARLQRAGETFALEDLQSKNGSLVNGVRTDRVVVRDGDLLELGGTFFIYRQLADADSGGPLSLLGGETLLPELASELTAARDVARSSVPLLILGETGTGKEVVARAAHAESGRKGPIVPVNCAALPATLVESELFGHKKGAFSGALADRVGFIASAHEGTLLLDEVGELRMPAEAALLRVLQDGEVTPIGATRSISCDVRVISATNRDLAKLVDAGGFRADLYARLSGFRLRLWRLRERIEDLGLLIAALLRRLAPERAATVTFSPSAARRLFQHDWPLNIRELEKALAAALVLSPERIELTHLQLSGPTQLAPSPPAAGSQVGPRSPEHDERRQRLAELLERHHGNISAVARELGKDRVQIRRWIRMYRLAVNR